MQKNEVSSDVLLCCQIPEPENRETILNEPRHLKPSSEAKSSPVINRDSGIFEDLFSLHLKDNLSPEPQSPSKDYFSFDHSPNHSSGTVDEDYNFKSKSNSDRILHASISSLNTEIDLLPSLSSLSSFSSSEEENSEEEDDEVEEEEEEEEQEQLEEDKKDCGTDEEEFDLNNDDIISVTSESENSSDSESSSFGYHSLLNDATPGDNSHFSSDFSKLSDVESDEESLNDDNSKASLNSCSEFQEYEPTSLNLVDTKHLSISNEILRNEGEEETAENNLIKEYSLSSLSLSVSTSSCSSEDESPSDIENKMAETEIKMNDSLLSNGREELSIHNRKMKHYLKTKDIKNALGEIPSHRGYVKDKTFLKNNLLHNNNYNKNHKLINNQNKPAEKQRMRPPTSLPLRNVTTKWDNKTNSGESPIIDAYEKECQDAPEKCAKESENKNKTKEKEDPEEKHQNGDEEPDEAEMKAFEAAMKQAIRRKEADSLSSPRINISFGDVELRHRPSPQQRRRERNALRRSLPQASHSAREKSKQKSPDLGEFDVYTMETALPKIDWDAIEAHLEATREEERRRRTDREEIRKKLAMGTDEDVFNDSTAKKPSLQSRLQNGKNLQICFMNETASDCESQCSDTESTQDRIDEIEGNLGYKDTSKITESEFQTMDFMTKQAKLQAEARLALSQAKEMARMQMEIEKQNQRKSPITEIIKDSFNKVGFPFPAGKRRMSRQLLTDMNVAQLQVIVNDLHTQIENLNEDLVQLLLNRDDLHMEQDSMLVDIEDLTKHLGAKQPPNATLCKSSTTCVINSNNSKRNNLRFSSSIIPTKNLKLRPTIIKK